MTRKIIPFFILISSFTFSCTEKKQIKTNSNLIKLETEFIKGYGPFSGGMTSLSYSEKDSTSSWYRTSSEVTGIPNNWESYFTDEYWLNSDQFVYQNYKAGKLDSAFFYHLVESWNINLDNTEFSDTPIICTASVVVNTGSPELEFIIDTNGDLDFSDEEIHQPIPFNDWSKQDSLSRHSILVDYEYIKDGEVQSMKVPVLILNSDAHKNLLIGTPLHLKSTLEGTDILINFGFRLLTFNNKSSLKLAGASRIDQPTEKNEYIVINNNRYINLGLEANTRNLLLYKIPFDSLVNSTQVGFHAIPFEENTFITDKKVSLDKYKGKYLYMEFWGSWCAPCIKEIPNLKHAYSNLDSSKIKFLGIAKDDSTSLHELLLDKGIEWDQILRNSSEGIIADYSIEDYPTSLLIDVKGNIVAKNLRGDNLLDTLNYYLN